MCINYFTKEMAEQTLKIILATQNKYPQFFEGRGAGLFYMALIRDIVICVCHKMDYVDKDGYDAFVKEIDKKISIKCATEIFKKNPRKLITKSIILSNFNGNTDLQTHLQTINHDIMLLFHNGKEEKIIAIALAKDYMKIENLKQTKTNLMLSIPLNCINILYRLDCATINAFIKDVKIPTEITNFIESYYKLKDCKEFRYE